MSYYKRDRVGPHEMFAATYMLNPTTLEGLLRRLPHNLREAVQRRRLHSSRKSLLCGIALGAAAGYVISQIPSRVMLKGIDGATYIRIAPMPRTSLGTVQLPVGNPTRN